MFIPKKRYAIPIFILFLILIRFVVEIGRDRTPADRYRVVRVIDGDTVELSGGDRLRLLGIDCPERGDPFYDSAAAFLAGVTGDQLLDVTYSQRRRDGYGRLLGYLHRDSLLINEAILRAGLGYVYLFPDNLSDSARVERLLAAQRQAILDKVGIWSLPVSEEDYYVAIKGRQRFHRPSCRSVAGHQFNELIRFSSRHEAFNQGYSPCRNCRP